MDTSSDINGKQNRIQEKVGRNDYEFFFLSRGGSGPGWTGSDPPVYDASASIKCSPKFCSWEKEDIEYHYLPGFGFKFEIGRQIISPYLMFTGNRIFVKGHRMTMGTENERTELWFTLPDNYDFFDVLNGIRAGNPFTPFQVRGKEEVVRNLKAPYFLYITAYVGEDELHAYVKDVTTVDVEGVIRTFIEIFESSTPELKTLKTHYQETDSEGTRLWPERGLQSNAYYRLRKKLSRKLLRLMMAVLKNHGIGYHTSWGFTMFVAAFREQFSEYGLGALLYLAAFVFHNIRNLFKGKEALRRERLIEYKEEEKRHERAADVDQRGH